MSNQLDVLLDRVIEFVNSGSMQMTDFVQKTAKELRITKAEVRAAINHYDANPGSPAGRPPAAEISFSIIDGDEGIGDYEVSS